MTKRSPIPEGYHAITPYLSIDGAAAAMDFYTRAFGAKELMRLPMPDGKVGHAEMQFGDSRIMLADEFHEMDMLGPKKRGGSSVGLMFYVPNVDEVVQRAVSAGAEIVRPLQDQVYGDRSCTLRDPAGHLWTIATHIEDVTVEEVQRRMGQATP